MRETRSGCLVMGTSSDGLYLLFTNRAVLHFNHTNGFPERLDSAVLPKTAKAPCGWASVPVA